MEKRFKKNTLLVLIMIVILSCKSNQNPEWFLEYRQQVKNKAFDKFLVKDKKTLNSYRIARYPALINEIGFSAVFINPYDNDSISYNKRIMEIKNNSIQKMDLSDKEKYFFIPINEEVKENQVPLPDVNHKELENFINIKEPVYYITDKNSGKFLIDEKNYYYIDSPKNDFKWKHGYTNGAIVDEKDKKIVYYLIIW